jgi:hypothetical protein
MILLQLLHLPVAAFSSAADCNSSCTNRYNRDSVPEKCKPPEGLRAGGERPAPSWPNMPHQNPEPPWLQHHRPGQAVLPGRGRGGSAGLRQGGCHVARGGRPGKKAPPAYSPARGVVVVVVAVGGEQQVGLFAAGPDRRRWGPAMPRA